MQLAIEFQGEIPEGWIPIESVAAVKCLDSDGQPALCLRSTEGLSVWESVGMLIGAADTARNALQGMFTEGSGE